jgi:hypothetical protein
VGCVSEPELKNFHSPHVTPPVVKMSQCERTKMRQRRYHLAKIKVVNEVDGAKSGAELCQPAGALHEPILVQRQL